MDYERDDYGRNRLFYVQVFTIQGIRSRFVADSFLKLYFRLQTILWLHSE